MSKVYDCFTYFNEHLLLSLRLETLANVVDTFVIAESTHTFSGKPKALSFDRNRFPRFAHRIIHVVVEDMPLQLGDAWANEAHQRNALLHGLKGATPDDRVIISDIDEIPRPDAINRYNPWYLYGSFRQRFYAYFVNNQAVSSRDRMSLRLWDRAKITTVSHLQRFFQTPQNLRIYRPDPGLRGALKHFHRKLRHQWLYDGGWHFSWMMTPEKMIEKIESFSHTELNLPHIKSVDAIRAASQKGSDILGKGEYFRLVALDESFPPYLRNHLDQFRHVYVDPTNEY
jgi:beta-1,4-mannosyl-glycoprotein beta-1,4-N-acetylglucosaminyltransferase